jgi:hypothetical protein
MSYDERVERGLKLKDPRVGYNNRQENFIQKTVREVWVQPDRCVCCSTAGGGHTRVHKKNTAPPPQPTHSFPYASPIEQLPTPTGRVGYHFSPRYFAVKTHSLDDGRHGP